MPESLKRDIKYFFDNKKTTGETAMTYLYSVGNPTLIEEKSIEAYQKHQIGEWNEHHSWVIPRKLIDNLPPELRIYVGCATQLYGDIDEFHLIKIHFTSGKVSLLRYEDWSIDTPDAHSRSKNQA
jgi:DNA phosphorothioation-associated putative methyltransferase